MLKNKKLILSLDKIMINSKETLIRKLNNYFDEVRYFYGSERSKKDENLYIKILKELSRKKLLKKYVTPLLKKEEMKYYNKIINNFIKIDYVLMIGGIYYSKEFIKLVKSKNSNIKFILFLWDKFDKIKIEKLKEYYDLVYTFEKKDAVENNIFWRPSFYVQKENSIKNIDFYFLGEIRDVERYEYINKLYKFCLRSNLNANVNLFSRKKLKNLNSNIITHKKIPYKQNIENMKRAKVTFEKNINNQEGLSLRSLECLAYKTKLITTNKDIRNYDFYNPKNIFIVEKIEDIDKIPIDFFKTEYENIGEETLKRYSFEGFIEEIFRKIGELE